MKRNPGTHGRMVLLVLMGMILAPFVPVGAQPADDFSHWRTGFPLTGMHERISCEGCHFGGVFQSTPKQCVDCHGPVGERIAGGKPTNHIPSSDRCGDCHVTTVWMDARFDHAGVTGACSSCHNGFAATGTPPDHVRTTSDCGACHRTFAWTPASFDHSGITGGCASCHNGFQATGKPGDHIPSSNLCEDCHNTSNWNARFDHAGITSGCASCHDGSVATGKPGDHIPSSNLCEDCHNTSNWNARFDHAGITSGCASCHDGSVATGKPGDHIPSSNRCEDCHTTVTWDSRGFDHAGITGNCASCHDGSRATGKDGGHFVTTLDCSACHTPTRWSLIIFRHTSPDYPGDHAGNLGCEDCHRGNSQTVPWSFGAYKPDCAGCHANDFKTDKHKKTRNPNTFYTVGELRDCTGACHVYTDSSMTTIDDRKPGPEHRVSRNGW